MKKLEFTKELKQQLAEKDRAIENWQTMYQSVVQTCHNDKEEIEKLNNELKDMSYSSGYQEYLVLKEKLEVEQTINKVLIEREREIKKQLAEKDEEIKVIDEDRQFKAEMWTKFADKCKELEKQIKQLKEIK